MFFAVLFLLLKTCASFSAGPPYGTCDSFSTGHQDTVSTSTVTISLLKGNEATSCYLPAEKYTLVFNASKKFAGVLLQSDVGALPAPNDLLFSRNLATGPCNANTISQRSILNVDSIQVSYKAPDYGTVTFRYTVVFRYNESLVNKKVTFQQCAPTSPPALPSVPAPTVAGIELTKASLQTNATCNKTTVLSFENQTRIDADGHNYTCLLTEPIKQVKCEPQCVRDGKTLCCGPDDDRATTPTKPFDCWDDGNVKRVNLTVVRRMRCVCTIATDGIC